MFANETREQLARRIAGMSTEEVTRRMRGFRIPGIRNTDYGNGQVLFVDRVKIWPENFQVEPANQTAAPETGQQYVRRVQLDYVDINTGDFVDEFEIRHVGPMTGMPLGQFVRGDMFLRNDEEFQKFKRYFNAPEMPDECPICFESLTYTNAYKLNYCGHMICRECREQPNWMNQVNRTCPVCRERPISQTRRSFKAKTRKKRKSKSRHKKKKTRRSRRRKKTSTTHL